MLFFGLISWSEDLIGHVESPNELQSFAQHFIPHRKLTQNYILLKLPEAWTIEAHWVCVVSY